VDTAVARISAIADIECEKGYKEMHGVIGLLEDKEKEMWPEIAKEIEDDE